MTRLVWFALPLLVACAGLNGNTDAYTGTIEVTEVEVASAIPGRLTAIHFDQGDRVEAGALAFAIAPEPLLAERALRVAAVDLAAARIRPNVSTRGMRRPVS